MVENKILFISNDDTFLLFDGSTFSSVDAKHSKDHYCGTVISASKLRPHGMRVPLNISPEKLEIQSEMSMYEEAGLDPETDYKIASVAINLENETELFVESYAVENDVLHQEFAPSVSKLKHIDYIVPSFLRYGALYAYEKLEHKNDVFIYFSDDEAYAAMYKNGHYLSSRTIMTLNELSQKTDIEPGMLKNLLQNKGVENELYRPEEFLKMTTIQEELLKIIERVSHAISHKRGIFGLDSIDRFFIDFQGHDIPGFLQLFQNYGFEGATFEALNIFDQVDADRYADALSALYLLGIVEGKYSSANLSIFERHPAFYKTYAGVFFIILAFSVLSALAYPVYGVYQLSELESEKAALESRVSAMEALSSKLQKKLKEVRLEKKALETSKSELEASLESYDALADTLKQQKVEKKSRQNMMKDVNEALASYQLSSRNLDQNGSDTMQIQIISEFDKRDDIAKFMKKLLAKGYLHVSTREIRREENLYESTIEIRP
jgi:hypothetical protein